MRRTRILLLALGVPALLGAVHAAPIAPIAPIAPVAPVAPAVPAVPAVPGAPVLAASAGNGGGAVMMDAPERSAGDGSPAAPFHRGGPPAPAAAETVLVARRDLPRGVAITATDFDVVVSASPARARSDAARRGERPGLGWVTRRVVRKGEPLRPPAVAPPPVVHSGSPVTVVWLVDGIRVTREGTALGTAHAGERVVVRVDAQRRVSGTATGPGLVTVAP